MGIFGNIRNKKVKDVVDAVAPVVLDAAKEKVEEIKADMDKNKDGKISMKEATDYIADSEFYGILIMIALILATAFLNVVSDFYDTGLWNWDSFLSALVVVVAPIGIAWLRKAFNTQTSRLRKEKEDAVSKLEQDIEDMKIKHAIEIEKLKIENQQLNVNLQLKEQWIELFTKPSIPEQQSS